MHRDVDGETSTNILHVFKRFQQLKRNLPGMKRRLLEIQADKKVLMEETSKIALRNRYRIEQLYKHCGCSYRKKTHARDFSVFHYPIILFTLTHSLCTEAPGSQSSCESMLEVFAGHVGKFDGTPSSPCECSLLLLYLCYRAN